MKNVNNKDKIINNLVGNTLCIEFPDGDEEKIESSKGYIVAESMSLKQSISEDGKFGGCVASEFSIQLVSTEDRRFSTDLKGKWINVSIIHEYAIPLYPSNSLYPSNDLYPGERHYTEKVELFSGYIDVAERDQSDSTKISVTAYDIFAKMNTFKATEKVLALFKGEYAYGGAGEEQGAALYEYILLCTNNNPIKKLPFNYSDFYNISLAKSDFASINNMIQYIHQRNKPWEKRTSDLTYGNVLRWICELFGAYAVIKPNDQYGELRIIASGSKETYDSYFSCNAEDYETYPYGGIIIPYYYYSYDNDGKIVVSTESTMQFEGESNYLSVCFAPPSSWLTDNNKIYVKVKYYTNNDSSTTLETEGQLVKSNKRITKENYVDDYGDRVLYSKQFFLSSETCTITEIIFNDDKGSQAIWYKNNENISTVSKTAHILNGESAVTIPDAISDFSYYDMTDNIFAWDEIIERDGGSVTYELDKIKNFYNTGHLKHRIPNCQFRPFTATVEGRTWVEVGDLVRINVPDADYDGCVYDETTGQKIDCDGFLVDETGSYIYADGTVIPYDEDTGEYASNPVSGTVRTKNVESIIFSRTLTGIQALTDVIEAKETS